MSTAGQTRRSERRAARQAKRSERKATRRARRQARRAERGNGSQIVGDVVEMYGPSPTDAPQTSSYPQIPGPGPRGTFGAGGNGGNVGVAPNGNGAAASDWWMDPKILILGAAALFILMRPKKAS